MKLPWYLVLAMVASIALLGGWIGWRLKPVPIQIPPSVPFDVTYAWPTQQDTIPPVVVSTPHHTIPTPKGDSTYVYFVDGNQWSVWVSLNSKSEPHWLRVDSLNVWGLGTVGVGDNGQPLLTPTTPGFTYTPQAGSVVPKRKNWSFLTGLGARWTPDVYPMAFGAIKYKRVWAGMAVADRAYALIGVEF